MRPLSHRTIWEEDHLRSAEPFWSLMPENERLALRPFGSVLGPPLSPVLDAAGVQGTSNNMIPYTGQVLDTTATDQYHRVFL